MPENFTITQDNLKNIEKSLRELARTRVLVGIPQENSRRRDGVIDNASLGVIHEFGSPIKGIPPRPFLHPGVQDSEESWRPHLEAAGIAAFEGRGADMERSLVRAGMVAVAAVKSRIVAGIPPPLKPATIARRRQRSPGSSYRRKAQTAVQTTPLVDTAQLLNAITSIIEKR